MRGYLDRWVRAGDPPGPAAARALVEAATALAHIGARPQAVWFYLWEMESMLESVAA